MHSETVAAVELTEDVFNLLKRRGPLCASQIAVELGQSLRSVAEALHSLKDARIIEPRPDSNILFQQEEETPWGLARPSWLKRQNP